ncbi:PP2C family protein-serine/threonine phosphatase [Streptomyces sp. NPDC058279]|uniref:PP2C family protein-serine/threonine phosphatase n=1 Tax=Streptomyces sp. NPDC058279 TaxID=3346418 RepID=UPI0036EE31CA
MLTSLAGLIAQALDRARLYDATRDLARGLQQALLPRSLPTLPGLQSAARYLPASRGMDNVSATALMGQVRTAIHATAGAPPDQVLARTNRVLADLETDLLVSCLYAHIDLTRQEAVLASAGHPPPLLHRPGMPPGVVGLDPGPLLGIGPGLSWRSTAGTVSTTSSMSSSARPGPPPTTPMTSPYSCCGPAHSPYERAHSTGCGPGALSRARRTFPLPYGGKAPVAGERAGVMTGRSGLMNNPMEQRSEGQSPLERVTGEKDVHPEEERRQETESGRPTGAEKHARSTDSEKRGEGHEPNPLTG